MTSLNNTVVKAGSGETITDSSGNRWTISPQSAVVKNGKPVAFTSNVAELAYVNDVIWHENTSGQWYSWSGTAWISGKNPLPPSEDDPTALLNKILANQQAILAGQQTILTEIKTMSQTIGDQLDAAQAQEATDAASTKADLAKLTTDLATLVAAFKGAPVGSTVTQAQVDAANAVDQTLQALDSSIQAADTSVNEANPAPLPTGTPVPSGAPTDNLPSA